MRCDKPRISDEGIPLLANTYAPEQSAHWKPKKYRLDEVPGEVVDDEVLLNFLLWFSIFRCHTDSVKPAETANINKSSWKWTQRLTSQQCTWLNYLRARNMKSKQIFIQIRIPLVATQRASSFQGKGKPARAKKRWQRTGQASMGKKNMERPSNSWGVWLTSSDLRGKRMENELPSCPLSLNTMEH